MIINALRKASGDRRLWLSPTGSWTLARELAGGRPAGYEPLRSMRVAVSVGNPVKFATLLCRLDGMVSELILLPPTLPPAELKQLLLQSAAEVFIHDRAESFPYISTLNPEEIEIGSGAIEDDGETRWVLATSGTTSTPKLISHSFKSLTKTVKAEPRDKKFRWGMLYDMSRFAGIQVFLQTVLGGAELVLRDQREDLAVSLRRFTASGVNALSATPTMWRKILMSPNSHDLHLMQATLGGEIADQSVLDALARYFPSARITHIYASTETGVGFAVSDKRRGFPAAWLDHSVGETELKLSSEGHLLIRTAANDCRHLSESSPSALDEGFIDTGDLVSLDGDRALFKGRASGSINVGGNKVQPEQIEAVLLSHPDVAEAKVSAIPNPIVGNIISADVVLKEKAHDLSSVESALMGYCRARLEPFMVPAILRFCKTMEISSSGKLQRGQN